MASQKNLDDIKKIIHISTEHEPFCEFCKYQHNYEKLYDIDFAVNHYIEKHGYKLLHLGSETNFDTEGNLLTSTVAIVGK